MSIASQNIRWLIAAVVLLLGAGAIAVAPLYATNYTLNDDSMEPAFSQGSQLFVGGREGYKPHDIIAIRYSGKLVTRRYLGLDAKGNLITQPGDTTAAPDLWPIPVTSANIEGKVVLGIPNGTALFFGATVLLALLGGLCIIYPCIIIPIRERAQEKASAATVPIPC